MPCGISPRGTPLPLFRTRRPFRNGRRFSFPSRAETPSTFFWGNDNGHLPDHHDRQKTVPSAPSARGPLRSHDRSLSGSRGYACPLHRRRARLRGCGHPLFRHGLRTQNLATEPPIPKAGVCHPPDGKPCSKFYAARFRAMYVGTAGPGVAFYARFGFTHSHTVTGFFTDNYPEPLYEDGVLLTDMLYLKKELA